MSGWEVRCGDALETLRTLPDGCYHCAVTSPPYWNLRNYNVEGQIGMETTPEEFTARLVEVFREVRRVLRDDGTLWLNLGDSMAAGKCGRDDQTLDCRQNLERHGNRGVNPKAIAAGNNGVARAAPAGYKAKDMVGIPWMVAFALRADGWYLRSDIVWDKPNPMPESVTDRPSKAHEFIFLLAKSATYFYDADAVREITGREADPEFYESEKVRLNGWSGPDDLGKMARQPAGAHGHFNHPSGRNKRDVWRIANHPFADAHFATFPPKLIEPCILAGSSERGCCPECLAPWQRVTEPTEEYADVKAGMIGKTHEDIDLELERGKQQGWGKDKARVTAAYRTLGWQPTCNHGLDPVPAVVLDCFAGSGTTGEVAKALGRHFIGIELSPVYAEMARNRIASMPSYRPGLRSRQTRDAGQLALLDAG